MLLEPQRIVLSLAFYASETDHAFLRGAAGCLKGAAVGDLADHVAGNHGCSAVIGKLNFRLRAFERAQRNRVRAGTVY